MAKVFETTSYMQLVNLLKVLGFTEDEAYHHMAHQRQYDKQGFNLFVDADGSFRLYKDGRSVLAGTYVSAEDQARLVEASRDRMYKTLDDWLSSRVTAAATYRRLADRKLDEARKELVQFSGLETVLTRSLHDLRKTAKIAEEGHQ